jgi:hypothetical protein
VRGASSVASVSDWSEPSACRCRAYLTAELAGRAHDHSSLMSCVFHAALRHVCTNMMGRSNVCVSSRQMEASPTKTRASLDIVRLSRSSSRRLFTNYANAGRQLCVLLFHSSQPYSGTRPGNAHVQKALHSMFLLHHRSAVYLRPFSKGICFYAASKRV